MGDIHWALGAVSKGEDTLEAIVPVENMIEGTINGTLDFLCQTEETKIVGELIMNIKQDIIGFQGTNLSEVTQIISHMQPLGQCRDFINKKMPNAKPESTLSTMSAIEQVAQKKDMHIVAIGNSSMNDKYGLVTLASNVSDMKNNKTRFLILRHQHEIDPNMPSEKISFVFSLPKDQPGGLYRILGLLQNLNLTKIESRPSKDVLGSYYFFIDVQGDYSNPDIRQTLQAVKANTETFKILGAYKEIKSC